MRGCMVWPLGFQWHNGQALINWPCSDQAWSSASSHISSPTSADSTEEWRHALTLVLPCVPCSAAQPCARTSSNDALRPPSHTLSGTCSLGITAFSASSCQERGRPVPLSAIPISLCSRPINDYYLSYCTIPPKDRNQVYVLSLLLLLADILSIALRRQLTPKLPPLRPVSIAFLRYPNLSRAKDALGLQQYSHQRSRATAEPAEGGTQPAHCDGIRSHIQWVGYLCTWA